MHPSGGNLPQPSAVDFDQAPFVAIWETTRSCDLACRHCRAEAIPERDPDELTTEEGCALLTEVARMGTPIFVLSGGDPAKRPDLCDLVRHGCAQGMRMATIPAATPLLDRRLVQNLKAAGLAQMALSLDGHTAAVHDEFRGVPGAFELTLRGAAYARQCALPLQINTTFTEHNWTNFDEMARLVKELGVVFWEVFFLVPMGRGRELGQLNARQFEDLFVKLEQFAGSVRFIVKITEAPHYRRYLMEKRMKQVPAGASEDPSGWLPPHMRRDFGPGGSIGTAPKGVNSGNGYLFVNYQGDIFPSGFLPLSCGNVRHDSITQVYRFHKVFRELRTPELLKGKCGICDYRRICGGSRARAYAMTEDYLAEEPFCAYEPPV
jgi:AdoMet-dependent heme synthase